MEAALTDLENSKMIIKVKEQLPGMTKNQNVTLYSVSPNNFLCANGWLVKQVFKAKGAVLDKTQLKKMYTEQNFT